MENPTDEKRISVETDCIPDDFEEQLNLKGEVDIYTARTTHHVTTHIIKAEKLGLKSIGLPEYIIIEKPNLVFGPRYTEVSAYAGLFQDVTMPRISELVARPLKLTPEDVKIVQEYVKKDAAGWPIIIYGMEIGSKKA